MSTFDVSELVHCILDPAKASSRTGILNLPLNKIDQHKEPAKYFTSGFDII